jgi:hypothetical protein
MCNTTACADEEQVVQWCLIFGGGFFFIILMVVCAIESKCCKCCKSEGNERTRQAAQSQRAAWEARQRMAETLEATLTSHPPPPSYDELDIEPLPTYDEVMLDMEPPMTTTTELAVTESINSESGLRSISTGVAASSRPPAYTIRMETHREPPPSYTDVFPHSEQHILSTYM